MNLLLSLFGAVKKEYENGFTLSDVNNNKDISSLRKHNNNNCVDLNCCTLYMDSKGNLYKK